MLNQNKPQAKSGADLMSLKPGSEPAHADLPHDFGADVNNTTERQYASQSALNQDPGRTQIRSNDERGGRRDAGAGTTATNAGGGSGGDLDTNEVGLDGRGLAESIPDAAERDQQGQAEDARFAPRLAERTAPLGPTDDFPRGGSVSVDRDTDGDNSTRDEGADALNTTASDDPYQDAAVGEISRGESMGPGDSSSSSARR